MASPGITVTVSSKGMIELRMEGEDSPLIRSEAVEIWHSQPDKGLALRFLESPGRSSLPLQKSGDDPALARIDAAAFLAKIGYELEEGEHAMKVGKYDETRKVLSTKW